MRAVWKYPLTDSLSQIDMPEDAEVLDVQLQGNIPHMWVLVNPHATLETRYFHMFGTGEPFDDKTGQLGYYCGTLYLDGGRSVLHVFEIGA